MYPGNINYCSPCCQLALLGKNPRLRGGQETLPQKSFLAEQIGPAVPPLAEDTLAERLRRRPAKPMGSPRVGSDPTGVVRVQSGFVWKANTLQVWGGMI